ncbi:MAG: AMP-binding protein [Actinomycetota bacterium]|nr:AMP-binding protein [Actinomycetota bacterium]
MVGRPLHAAVLPAGPQLIELLSAALDGGPALLPVEPRMPAPARERLLVAMRPATVISTAGAERRDGSVPVADEVAVVVATSGSSGRPKGVELSAGALRHSAAATLRRVGARPGDRWLCCLPTSHVGGLQVLVRSLLAGTDPVLVERFAPEAVAAAGVEHVAVVPTMLIRLLDAGVDLSRFRTLLVGGGRLTPELRARAVAAGGTVIGTYGLTETAGGCVYDGLPLDGVHVDLDPDGRIVLAGDVLARGYRLQPDATSESFVDGRLITHDVGRWGPDGRLEVLGRVDDVVVTGGVNVAAGEVADLLSTHPGVAQVAVTGRPDDEWGQRVVAVVVPRDRAAPPTLTELRRHVLATAPAALAPREVQIVAELPVLPSGKVDRLALRALGR